MERWPPARRPRGRPDPYRTGLRHLVSFGVVGVLATAITLGLYVFFRTWWPPVVANLVAVTLSTLFNTEANRRFTFRGRSPSRSRTLVHGQSFVVFGLYCGFTSGALLLLHAVADHPSQAAELVALVAASAFGTLGRFLLLSNWVFRHRPAPLPLPETCEKALT